MASRKTSRSYDHCTNAQLAEIAHEHSTTVPSPSVPPKTLLVKCDYLEAPKTTDETSSFPFMELSPELRNGVYKQLLTFEDSRTCFPQILATSKQVNREGSGILYGDNVIEIHMISDGICVHGELISTAARNDFTGMFDECLWPRWLRRVQVVQFSLHHDLGTDVTVFGPESEDGFFDEDVDAVLKSLCSHLAPRHSLRSFRLNIRGNNTDQLLRVTPHMLHSTRLLGRLEGIQFQGDISSHDLGLQRQKSMVEAVADVWTRLKALAEFTASDKASAWSSYYLTRKISVEHWALEQCHTLDTLPEARRVQHMVGSVLRLGERVQDLAVRLNRDLMVDGRRALPDPLKYASYSACLNELVVACIGLEAAEYQAARDELERSPDLAS